MKLQAFEEGDGLLIMAGPFYIAKIEPKGLTRYGGMSGFDEGIHEPTGLRVDESGRIALVKSAREREEDEK